MARITIQTLCGLVLLAVTATPAAAAPVDRFGTTVDYLAIVESVLANTSGGTPTFDPAGSGVAGDTISFNPMNFSSSSNGGGIDVTDVQLNMTLMSHAGYAITDVQFDESGDFSLLGLGTAATNVTYALALATIKVLEVDGVPLNVPISGAATFAGMDDLVASPGALQLWNLSADFDVEQLLIDNSIPFTLGASKVEVAIDNQLIAISEASSFAFIAKKDFQGVGITVVTVPEPSTAGILCLSAVGLGNWRRRRSL